MKVLLIFKTFKDLVQVFIEKYERHDSINLIRKIMRNLDNSNFCFKYISFDQTLSEVQFKS